MDIMHITIQSFQRGVNTTWPSLHLHTNVRLGGSDTTGIEFYAKRPLGLFCMDLRLIPTITEPQLGTLHELYRAYRAYRGGVWYRKGLRHAEDLKNGVTPKELPWPK